ncbi:MBL fold metallo-hydrolase [[Clostridium] dakarense]|uniref:MBL fold metallo-hydrolase n=1 Tax=Faecalimicrobium dakarense TaxID=1301100 RepID=UPI0004B74972|nr:MBL fold metallo-hydrolase [[Clostridium] dakarense]
MDLTNIKENTFYIKGGTNTGIYLYDDNSALIIDPGLCGLRPKRIIDVLKSNNIKPKFIINTHEHNDHYGACNQFREEYKDLSIISSKYAKLYIENPELFSKYIIGGKSNKFMDGKLRNKSLDEVQIDEVISEGVIELNNVEFNIIDFKGHTPGSIGILTKDKVLFVGDLLIGEDMLSKYDFLFMYDIKDQIDSLDKLKNIDFDYLVVSHGRKIISKCESYNLINKHKEAIEKYLNQIREQLKEPIGLENLLKNIIKNNNLSNNYKEYHFFKSSLLSIISHLADLEEVEYLINEGELLYYTQKK